MTILDRAWINCKRMWKWISENLPEGFAELMRYEKKEIVNGLKSEWLIKFRFTREIEENCFFCDYAKNPRSSSRCASCPAKRVEVDFHCNLNGDSVNWIMNPIGFYNNLVRLDNIRDHKNRDKAAEADYLKAERKRLTNQEQLKRLDDRLGVGIGAAKERRRLMQ